MPYETLKFFHTSLNFFVNVRFFSIFGTKRKHTSPTSFESAKDLARISVLEEKLDLWWKLQFPVHDAKTLSMFSLMFAFSRFLAQNANILVQPVLNLQKIWPE